jgi:hypothetical protein
VNAVAVRVAHAQPVPHREVTDSRRLESLPGAVRVPGYLVVLADDAGHRALPAWVWRPNLAAMSIQDLLDRRADDIWTTVPVPEELAVRLTDAAGGSVTGVEIYPVAADPEEVNADTCAARVELGARHVTARLDQGLTLAVVAGAPVRVESALMDRLAVPVPGDDPAAPFRGPAAGRGPSVAVAAGERPRFEPRNMTFADGLDRWHLASEAPDDFSAVAEGCCAVLASAVPEPSGSAVLLQAVFADDYRGARLVLRGEVRTDSVAGSAGLCLTIGWPGKEQVREDARFVATVRSSDWSGAEISVLVPEQADVIRFGVVLTGSGQVWLRNPELRRDA